MSKRALFLAPLLLSLAACAGTTKVMLSSPRPPVDPATVRVYTAVPPGAVQIAQLEAQSAVGFGTQGQTDAAMRRLKNEAAKLGANGVVLIGAGAGGRSPVGLSVGGGSYGGHVGGGIGIGIPTQQKQANGVAIYVPPGAERAAEMAPATP
ncbi:hypothetical protein [Pseudoxanthomonas winnipegensis]|jgi:hypothetical protein|uniref:Lipoprotein n=1 Tax=Pseudoxanthomonas winnipegensis TaxID=2480810 RepID=A0A4Q8L535_9GAMM|nr:hypothetical protein [Pseudoxanthomonas winnipegensis]TAA21336.1 hypothetical protein EA660_17665 [Pseudoxanthomonas winnipegensis]